MSRALAILDYLELGDRIDEVTERLLELARRLEEDTAIADDAGRREAILKTLAEGDNLLETVATLAMLVRVSKHTDERT